jgi:hypothetical protein
VLETLSEWPVHHHLLRTERNGATTTIRKLFPLRSMSAVSPGGTRAVIVTPAVARSGSPRVLPPPQPGSAPGS